MHSHDQNRKVRMAQLTALFRPGRVRTLTLVSGIPMVGSPLRLLLYLHLDAFPRLATRRYGPRRGLRTRS
jgi:hypothetical protein